MRNKSNLYDGGDGTSSESEDVESDDESSGTDQDTHYELQKPDYISPEMRDFITADQNVEMWGLLIYKPPRGLQHLMTASERNSIRKYSFVCCSMIPVSDKLQAPSMRPW